MRPHLHFIQFTKHASADAVKETFESHREFAEWAKEQDPELVKNLHIWGTYGRDGRSPLRWVKLVDCSTEHLLAILETQPQLTDLTRWVIESILRDRKRNRVRKKRVRPVALQVPLNERDWGVAFDDWIFGFQGVTS